MTVLSKGAALASAAASPLELSGFSSVAGEFEAVISDVWGVIHDGRAAFPAALDCLARLRARGLPVVLVSNTPRPAPPIHEQLAGLGVEVGEHYDALVTAGDIARALLIERFAGQRCYHVGPERDLPLFEQVPVQRVAAVDAADVLLCSGFVDEERETAEDYRALFTVAVARNLPLICANPDLIVHLGDDILLCAGTLAQFYSELGGTVHYCGKPYGGIYERALKVIGACRGRPVTPARLVAIGDAVHTDILGAQGLGIRSLLITSGIHRDLLGDLLAAGGNEAEAVAALGQTHGAVPEWIMGKLAW